MTFPQGWTTRNEKQGVSATPGSKDAILNLALAKGDPMTAATEFAKQEGVQAGAVERGNVNGLSSASLQFQIQDAQGSVLAGMVTFIRHGANTFQLLGYSTEARYAAYKSEIGAWIRSFERLADPRVLSIQPMRLRIETLRQPATVSNLAREWNSPVKPETLALINAVSLTEVLPAGRQVKRVAGEKFQ
jgi:predicted Zn-dependent protease